MRGIPRRPEQWKRKRNWLRAQMKRAPKPPPSSPPTTSRPSTWRILRAAGIAVPEQVAIVGAENYLLAPDAMITPISSVTPISKPRYRGAALLDDLMNGKKAPKRPSASPPPVDRAEQ
jgi:hypothetical protein